MGDPPRHPLLVDTSSLVAIANTDLWDLVSGTLSVTTTNVCRAELKTHVDSATHPPEGSRERYLERGSQRALACLDDPNTAFSCVTVVPRPHGTDAGEQSLQQEIAANPAPYQVVSVLDSAARRSLRRDIEQRTDEPLGCVFRIIVRVGVVYRFRRVDDGREMLSNLQIRRYRNSTTTDRRLRIVNSVHGPGRGPTTECRISK